MSVESIPVRIRDCTCPQTPHPDGDFLYFAPKLSLEAGLAAAVAIRDNADDEIALQAALGRVLFLYNVMDWNLTDEKGHKRPFVRRELEAAVPWEDGGYVAAEKADDLYSAVALSPLVRKMRDLSSAGRTGNSRSPKRRTQTGRRPLSGPSSATAA